MTGGGVNVTVTDPLPPVAMRRAASRHAAPRAPKRRRGLRLTAALATLAGSAAIAGTYVFSSGSDTTGLAQGAPATRLEPLDEYEDPAASPSQDRARGTLPGSGESTTTSGHDIMEASPAASASASASASAGDSALSAPTSPRTSAAPVPVPGQDGRGPTTTSPAPAPSSQGPTLRRHDRGAEVVELQQRMSQLGRWPFPHRGHFNKHLYNAVQQFQADHGIRDDVPGVYGPSTRRQLESMTS
ncbi:peptidoglycan-binding domain-containing protein [Streptomyces ficellus]|uniref:Peptidoglycan-binding protein n=1 Tax=Streptomyces ficellus TaxID=1977088 RepID=A0A6I6F344_9ACTN|nr:peptidoglycan-binding domain-containing protein [Streptomyces ficellus]QGV77034.1 peptidoglycan-binding protein [Streptomyces ficellus]